MEKGSRHSNQQSPDVSRRPLRHQSQVKDRNSKGSGRRFSYVVE
jgi:hypothetical protein